MDVSATSFETLAASMTDGLDVWLSEVFPERMVWAVLICVVLVAFRRQITTLGLKLLSSLLNRFSVVLADEVAEQLRSACEILVSAFALFAAVQLVIPDGVAKLFLERLLASVAILAVFGAWYRLSGPFASLL